MIDRRLATLRLDDALARSPVVVLTGPRQVGKSTLARSAIEPPKSHLFDLEDPRDLARLSEPTRALGNLAGTVVVDEAQHQPSLFPALRVLVDENPRPGRFLVLGSASPELVGLAAESLAGRVTLIELSGFWLGDVGASSLDRLWMRGGLPPSFIAESDLLSARWRDDYVRTFLERDLAQLGFKMPATTMRRFWMMIAHYHGQLWNGSELARSMGVSQPTVSRYLDALTDALVVRQLQPWFANISKRQVRSPKVFVRDSGILHRLLGIDDRVALDGHPKVGASWEGFVIEQLMDREGAPDAWFWATHSGAELDLFMTIDGARVGIEVKLSDHPKATPSMRHALEDLDLDLILVAHAGAEHFTLGDRIEAVSARELIIDGVRGFLR